MMLKLELFSIQILQADPRCTLTIMTVDWHSFFSVISLQKTVTHNHEFNGISISVPGPICNHFVCCYFDSVSIFFVEQLNWGKKTRRLHSIAWSFDGSIMQFRSLLITYCFHLHFCSMIDVCNFKRNQMMWFQSHSCCHKLFVIRYTLCRCHS